MKDPLQLLAEQNHLSKQLQDVLNYKSVSPAIGQFAMQDREQLIAGIEGALRMLENNPAQDVMAAVSILNGALRK